MATGGVESSVGDLLLGLVAYSFLAFAAGFLIGSINPATMIARVLGQDLSAGSGNPGATNAGRVLGVRWGIVVGVADVLKGFLPVLVAQQVFDLPRGELVGLGLVFGHIWSPLLRGRGGKGVATTLGVVLALSPWLALVLLVVFAVVYWRTHWVASGSIAASGVLITVGFVPTVLLVPSTTLTEPFLGYQWVWLAIGLVVLYRHRGNVNGYLAARRMRRAQGGDSA